MDKNQAIGFFLLATIMIVWFQFFTPDLETVPVDNPVVVDSLASKKPVQDPVNTPAVAISDSLQQFYNTQQFGIFSPLVGGTSKNITLENEDLIVVLNSAGGKIEKVTLKKYLTFSKDPLVLVDSSSSDLRLLVNQQGKTVDLNDDALIYQTEQTSIGDTTIIKFVGKVSSGQELVKTFVFPPTGYNIGFDLTSNIDQILMGEVISLDWLNSLKHIEHDIEGSRAKTTVNYYTAAESFDRFSEGSTDNEAELLEEPVVWVGMKQKFFTSAIIAQNANFSKADLSMSTNPDDTLVVKTTRALLDIKYGNIMANEGEYSFYFGPNNYEILKKVAPGFEKNLNLGYPPLHLVNKWVIIPLFHILEKYIGNYGIIIIILVLIIKMFLAPLSYKSYKSMAKMKVLKPEIDALKEKFGDDAQKLQQEQLKLYRQVGVNPVSGCVPMLLQMPILFAMFFFFPNSIELRGESFLWAHDLSTYDSILTLPFEIPFYGSHVSLFVLLMTAAQLAYTWSNNQVSTVQGPMQTVSYIMPVMFLFILNKFPAALSFYYFISTLITFIQQMVIKRYIDEDKIKAILDENRKNRANKKKSKFAMRMEEAMKAGQDAKNKKKNKK